MLQMDGRSLGYKLFKNYHLSQPKGFKPLILVGKFSVLGGEGMPRLLVMFFNNACCLDMKAMCGRGL